MRLKGRLTIEAFYKSAICAATASSVDLPITAIVQDDNWGLEQIAVTTRRMEKRLQDVPISITVYNQQQLTDRNIVTAGYLATYTPSLSASTQFGSDNRTVSIRDFTQENRTAAPVAVNFAGLGGAYHTGATLDRRPNCFFSLITARF